MVRFRSTQAGGCSPKDIRWAPPASPRSMRSSGSFVARRSIRYGTLRSVSPKTSAERGRSARSISSNGGKHGRILGLSVRHLQEPVRPPSCLMWPLWGGDPAVGDNLGSRAAPIIYDDPDPAGQIQGAGAV